ncbi:MAG: DegV family protein [Halothermotrichaceae bacterium]
MTNNQSKQKTALLTDSTCDLPEELLEKYSIYSLPLKIIYGNKEYRDRIDIEPNDVCLKFEEEIPTTSMPGPDEIKQKFIELREKGYTQIIAIHISSGLSGTYNISKMVSKDFKNIKIEVIDSKMLSLGLGRLVLFAKDLINKNKISFEEIVKKIKDHIDNIKVFFVVGTLKYLKKGGRIGKVKGTIGQLLNIKPIISIDEEGKYFTFDRARSREKSINKLFKISKERINEGNCAVDVMHADAVDEAKKLLNKLKQLKNVKKSFLGEISPAMVVHAGPGLLGVCINVFDKKLQEF